MCVSLGASALVFAVLPGDWPNPLPEGPLDLGRGASRLRAAAAAVDAACARGDLAAFGETTTPAHRQQLARRLQTVDLRLDAGTLRDLGNRVGNWLDLPLLAGRVHGACTAVAVARPAGDGAQVLTFVWDGQRLRFDGSRHAAAVRSTSAAVAAVTEAVARLAR